jgi:hypothetical protein
MTPDHTNHQTPFLIYGESHNHTAKKSTKLETSPGNTQPKIPNSPANETNNEKQRIHQITYKLNPQLQRRRKIPNTTYMNPPATKYEQNIKSAAAQRRFKPRTHCSND